MLFSSITFLYYFLPVILILYFLVPDKMKNGALLLASLVFYAWGEPKYVFLMIGMILADFVFGLLLNKHAENSEKSAGIRKCILFLALTVNIGSLCLFKFSDIAWPIGISFYTFQLVSYLADVYRGTVPAQKNLIHLAAYVTMFPQLIAGPIVRYSDIAAQLKIREHSFENFVQGFHRFLVGLGKKILISNALGELCAVFQASSEQSVLYFWVYAVSYSLQLYFDFSGYSDMAIGLGRIFGFHFSENFDHPYISGSITEFWRRWHMSLGSWFRDYVYIPLGGNRVPKWRWYVNILIVWSLTGIWHGAAVNFLVWGLMFALLLVAEKMWLLKYLNKAKVWNHVYVLLAVMVSFVIFNAADMGEALRYLRSMFGMEALPLLSAECIYYLKSYGVLLLAAVIGATPAVRQTAIRVFGKLQSTKNGCIAGNVVQTIWMLILLVVCTAYLIDSSFNPFLYFRF